MTEYGFDSEKIKLGAKTQRLFRPALFAVILMITANVSFAQSPIEPKSAATPHAAPAPKPPKKTYEKTKNETGIPAEKFISTDAKVNISVCVSQGNIKINGWERDEIRAFVSEGTEVGFAIRNKNKETGKPNWIEIQAFDRQNNKTVGLDECLSGDEIEIDVPRGATVNFKGTEAEITIESVNKVVVENDGGNVSLNNIRQGIRAKTYRGDVTVENSSGAIILSSTNGNIVAFDTEAHDFADAFTAKTSSGAITLQKVGHRQLEVASNSGAVRFSGEFLSGGQYTFNTTNGSILLSIPPDSSFAVNASYGGVFQTEIPLSNASLPSPNARVKTLTGNFGAGDASVTLTTLGGAISIRKN